MLCESCNSTVKYVLRVFEQLYDEDGLEKGVAQRHVCSSCIQNLDKLDSDDSEDFIGTPRTR